MSAEMGSSALFTIRSAAGLFRTERPEGGEVVYLFHDKRLAQKHIAHTEIPSQWTIEPVNDHIQWLASLHDKGFAYVYEVPSEGIGEEFEIIPRIGLLQTLRAGRDFHNRN